MATNGNEVTAFLYIPDMTGFTEFMTTTDSRESHEIVQEMLKSITEANILSMKISDIIGDAVFFYKEGSPPAIHDVIRQSKIIFDSFHRKLSGYGIAYNWESGKFEHIHKLSIKFIAHYGVITLSEIENHISLIGTPAIEANRLLKNSVVTENYLLLTEKYVSACTPEHGLPHFEKGSDAYEHLGEISYRTLNLTPHKE